MKAWRFNQSPLQMFALPLLLALATGCGSVGADHPNAVDDAPNAQQLPFTESKPVVVPASTAIYVRLQEPLSTANAQAGQIFSAVLDEPLLVDNQAVAPQGALLTGKVLAVRDAGRMHNARYMRITLSSITLNGKTVPLQTNSIFVGGGSYKNRDLAFIGGGASGGAPLGAAGGTPAAHAPGQKEVRFAPEQRLSFHLTQPPNTDTSN